MTATTRSTAKAEPISSTAVRGPTLYGGDGSDTLAGGTGADRIDGGEGRDLFDFDQGSGSDVITDFDMTMIDDQTADPKTLKGDRSAGPERLPAMRLGDAGRVSLVRP